MVINYMLEIYIFSVTFGEMSGDADEDSGHNFQKKPHVHMNIWKIMLFMLLLCIILLVMDHEHLVSVIIQLKIYHGNDFHISTDGIN